MPHFPSFSFLSSIVLFILFSFPFLSFHFFLICLWLRPPNNNQELYIVAYHWDLLYVCVILNWVASFFREHQRMYLRCLGTTLNLNTPNKELGCMIVSDFGHIVDGCMGDMSYYNIMPPIEPSAFSEGHSVTLSCLLVQKNN